MAPAPPPARIPLPTRIRVRPDAATRPLAPPAADEAGKPRADDEDEDDGVTPGGMGDGGPEPDGM
jgi:hypothetical protein